MGKEKERKREGYGRQEKDGRNVVCAETMAANERDPL